ncbi:MAG: DNA translocase FtsK 4TM domain-containing protein [bacterium]
MNKKKKHTTQNRRLEFLGLLLILVGLLILLSLVSYKTTDWPNSSSRVQVQNWMGLAGAWLSFYLFNYTIGYPVLILPILIMYLGFVLVRGGSFAFFFRLTGYVLFFAFCFSVAFALPRTIQDNLSFTHEFNGFIGLFFAKLLHTYLGSIGSVLVLFAALLLAFLSVADVSISKAFHFFTDEIKSLYTKIRLYLSELDRRQRLKRSLKKKERKIHKAQVEPTPVVSQTMSGQSIEIEESPPLTEFPVREPILDPDTEKPAYESAETAAPIPTQVSFDFGEDEEDVGIEPAAEEEPIVLPESRAQEIPEDYQLPPLDLLDTPAPVDREQVKSQLLQEARLLEEKLGIYGIDAKVVQIHPGPLITQFEVEPGEGVKVSKFFAIADDLAMVMRAAQVRILAPIPGKPAVGIEIPNRNPQMIWLRQVLDTEEFRNPKLRLPIALGVDPTGKPYITDLIRMPHLLVAGSTGSGKSVCLNTIITSLLYRLTPAELRLILIDPKKLELSTFAELRLHHLITIPGLNEEIITTPENAVAILGRVWQEMENRFNILASAGVRTLEDYNDRVANGELNQRFPDKSFEKIPYCIIIIDELADLLMQSPQEVEEPIGRLAHKARAVGIHLIVATQRPSTDVITGAIKANFPCRVAFKVFSKTDSRVVLDFNGAERLLGRGDMLFQPPGQPQPLRFHAPFMSIDETNRVIQFVGEQPPFPEYPLPEMQTGAVLVETIDGRRVTHQRDPLFNEALKLVVRHNQGSISLLQRRLRVGYARAARLVDELEQAGYVGAPDGSKARDVLVTEDDIEEMGIY